MIYDFSISDKEKIVRIAVEVIEDSFVAINESADKKAWYEDVRNLDFFLSFTLGIRNTGFCEAQFDMLHYWNWSLLNVYDCMQEDWEKAKSCVFASIVAYYDLRY